MKTASFSLATPCNSGRWGSIPRTGKKQFSSSILLGMGVSMVLMAGPIAWAGVLRVDADASGVDADGSTWGKAYPSLQNALIAAVPGDEIWVAEGTYYPDEGSNFTPDGRGQGFRLRNGIAVYGGFVGNETQLSERDHAAHPTVLSGDLQQNDQSGAIGDNAFHVVVAPVGTDGTAILSGFTITGGHANGSAIGELERGAGLYCLSASPTILSCTFLNNRAVRGFGGAVYNSGSAPTLTGCKFVGNRVVETSFVGLHGGAIYNLNSSPKITLCTFQRNAAVVGGAISNGSGSNPEITNCVFSENFGLVGGAINVEGASPTLSNCSFQGNQVIGDGFGGAIAVSSTASPTFNNCLIWSNSAPGGGFSESIYSDNGTPSFNHCLIEHFDAAGLVGTGNLDGISDSDGDGIKDNDPLFVFESHPVFRSDYMTDISGSLLERGDGEALNDLRLRAGSPAIGAGNNTANDAPLDSLSATRRVGTIDIGAYEHQGVLYVDDDPSGAGNDGSSWIDAYQDLSTALSMAKPGQELQVAEGVYKPTGGNDRARSIVLREGVFVNGGFPDGGGVRDPRRHESILSGDIGVADDASDNSYHVLIAEAVSSLAAFDGFTITGGHASGEFVDGQGGGLQCKAASPLFIHCRFTENTGGQGGGAACLAASPIFVACRFSGNRATANGGAVYGVQAAAPWFINCELQGNAAASGGAFYGFGAAPTLLHCSLQGNRSDGSGGAIYGFKSAPFLANSIIWNNSAAGSSATTDASITEVDGRFDVYRCLVENHTDLTLNGASNLDGVAGSNGNGAKDNDPLFRAQIDPQAAPGIGGDLRLMSGSPAILGGLDNWRLTRIDFAGNPRFTSTGDEDTPFITGLGAHEHGGAFYVDASAPTEPTPDGKSWETAFSKLQDALSEAPAASEIRVAEGTYYPDEGGGKSDNDPDSSFQIKEGVIVLGGFPAGGGALAERNPSRHLTVLSGDIDGDGEPGGNAHHVVSASGVSPSTHLEGLIITEGFNESAGSAGLLLDVASPSIVDTVFRKNVGSTYGGAILISSGSNPSFRRCHFVENQANHGGAIRVVGASPEFVNTSFSGNASYWGEDPLGRGGAVNHAGGASPQYHNCAFTGNLGRWGGAVANFSGSIPVFTGCTFSGNAGSGGGAFFNDASFPGLINCLIWNNSSNGVVLTPSASVFDVGGSLPSYSHSLLEQIDLTGVGMGNLDGTDPAVDPLFALEIDPATVPATGGDFRLLAGSTALDIGDNDANKVDRDLAGRARIHNGRIDLGAHEANFEIRFEVLYPHLTREGDANGNQLSNFEEYAAGGDPEGADDPTLRPHLVGDVLTYSLRSDADDLKHHFMMSESLEADSWMPMDLGTHYSLDSFSTVGSRTFWSMKLIGPFGPVIFFRVEHRAP